MLDRDPLQANSSPPVLLHCVCFGVPFQLSVDDARLLPAVLGVLPYRTELLTHGTPGAQPFHVTSPQADGLDLPSRFEQLSEDLMVHVANHAPDRVFLHAGVVGWQGRAIVIPGRSFAGKTTLVAGLVRAGAIYYSDEYAVLDDNGFVHPYARELQMRQPDSPEQRGVPVESLHGTSGVLPLCVAQVIFAEYRSGAVWAPEPVSPGMAVLEMLRHTIPVQRTPARVMATLTRMMDSAVALRSERGEASAAVEAILASSL